MVAPVPVLVEPEGHEATTSVPVAPVEMALVMAVAGSAVVSRSISLPVTSARPVLAAGTALMNKPAAPPHPYCPGVQAAKRAARDFEEAAETLAANPGSKS
jgi:hypothetical protein